MRCSIEVTEAMQLERGAAPHRADMRVGLRPLLSAFENRILGGSQLGRALYSGLPNASSLRKAIFQRSSPSSVASGVMEAAEESLFHPVG